VNESNRSISFYSGQGVSPVFGKAFVVAVGEFAVEPAYDVHGKRGNADYGKVKPPEILGLPAVSQFVFDNHDGRRKFDEDEVSERDADRGRGALDDVPAPVPRMAPDAAREPAIQQHAEGEQVLGQLPEPEENVYGKREPFLHAPLYREEFGTFKNRINMYLYVSQLGGRFTGWRPSWKLFSARRFSFLESRYDSGSVVLYFWYRGEHDPKICNTKLCPRDEGSRLDSLQVPAGLEEMGAFIYSLQS